MCPFAITTKPVYAGPALLFCQPFAQAVTDYTSGYSYSQVIFKKAGTPLKAPEYTILCRT